MNDQLYRDILGFIGRFSTDGYKERQEVIDAFLFGCCYWFAYILCARFSYYNPVIVHDNINAHFACQIDGRVYDIRGDITDMDYHWTVWREYGDATHKKRIIEQCIMF